jgi:glycosyltransferase involved in cell wall biosynthesis
MSTKILEFMSLGVPVIVSDTRIHKHYFQEPAVKFFKAEDERELAECMRLLYHDRDLREDLIQKGYEIAGRYGWDKKKEEYLSLMERLTEKEK